MKTQARTIDTATVESAAATIMRYLHDHPDSADTVEGVAEWWLRRQHVSDTLAIVNEALELLAADGSVQQRRTADGRLIYKLASYDAET